MKYILATIRADWHGLWTFHCLGELVEYQEDGAVRRRLDCCSCDRVFYDAVTS